MSDCSTQSPVEQIFFESVWISPVNPHSSIAPWASLPLPPSFAVTLWAHFSSGVWWLRNEAIFVFLLLIKMLQEEVQTCWSQLTEILQVSSVTLVESGSHLKFHVELAKTSRHLCGRCRRFTAHSANEPCDRCQQVLDKLRVAIWKILWVVRVEPPAKVPKSEHCSITLLYILVLNFPYLKFFSV